MSEMQIIGTTAPMLCDCGCGQSVQGVGQFLIIGNKTYVYGHHLLGQHFKATPHDRHAEGVAAGLEMAAKEAEKFASSYDKAASEDDTGSDSYRARCKEAGEVLRFGAIAIRALKHP